jgi:hypothetical protein
VKKSKPVDFVVVLVQMVLGMGGVNKLFKSYFLNLIIFMKAANDNHMYSVLLE